MPVRHRMERGRNGSVVDLSPRDIAGDDANTGKRAEGEAGGAWLRIVNPVLSQGYFRRANQRRWCARFPEVEGNLLLNVGICACDIDDYAVQLRVHKDMHGQAGAALLPFAVENIQPAAEFAVGDHGFEGVEYDFARREATR